MELNTFIQYLEESLMKRGISPDVAEKHVYTLKKTFTDDDLREIQNIQSADEVEEIAESIASLLKKNHIKVNRTKETTVVKSQPIHEDGKASKDDSSPIYLEDDDYLDEENPSGKGFYIFWLVFIFTLPITLALAAAFFGVFLGAFAALAALIVGLIAGLIGLVAVGAGVSLVGIIFGITQLFTFMAAGLYEIGLGVMIIGIVMLAGILLYNFAIRFLPWLIRKVGALLLFTCRKIRLLFTFLRKECYKL